MKKVLVTFLAALFLFTVSCKDESKVGMKPGEEPKTKRVAPKMTEEELLAKAKEIHKNVITLDTHDDIDTKNFTEERTTRRILKAR
ncbi:MAG: hypothetical protein R2681_06440 [Pyrinomonadaceae bacterium]